MKCSFRVIAVGWFFFLIDYEVFSLNFCNMFKIIWFQNIFLDLNLELLKSHSWIRIWDKSFWIDNIAFEKFTWQSCGMWILLNFFLQLKHSQEMSYIVQYVLCSGLPVKAFWLLDSTILSNSLYKINYLIYYSHEYK